MQLLYLCRECGSLNLVETGPAPSPSATHATITCPKCGFEYVAYVPRDARFPG